METSQADNNAGVQCTCCNPDDSQIDECGVPVDDVITALCSKRLPSFLA